MLTQKISNKLFSFSLCYLIPLLSLGYHFLSIKIELIMKLTAANRNVKFPVGDFSGNRLAKVISSGIVYVGPILGLERMVKDWNYTN